MVKRLAYTYSTIGYGIVMVLAARGFVLWIINAILTGIIIKISLDMIYVSLDFESYFDTTSSFSTK